MQAPEGPVAVPAGRLVELRLGQAVLDPEIQSRAELNEGCVADYAAEIRAGAEFPPVVVYYDGSRYWLASGFHRWYAHKKAGRKTIRARVIDGTRREAILASAGSNKTHGLQRTNEDKRRSVMMLLSDAEWGQWAGRQIAEHCGVSEGMVRNLRGELREEARRAKSGRAPYADQEGAQSRKLPPGTDPKDVPKIKKKRVRLIRKARRACAQLGEDLEDALTEQRLEDLERRDRGQPKPDARKRLLEGIACHLRQARTMAEELTGDARRRLLAALVGVEKEVVDLAG